MQTPVPDYLAEILNDCNSNDGGELADYIPELAQADPNQLGVAITTLDGVTYSAGDDEVQFSIQSISKPFAYALAIEDRGLDAVLEVVGDEPTGDAFNEISLEPDTGRPRNPMINIGAITTHSLVGAPGLDVAARFERARSGMSAFAGRELEVDDAVFESEVATGYRNTALAYLVRARDKISEDPGILVREYTRQCSVLVSVRDLSVMAATLANGGTNPVTGVQVVSPRAARQVMSVMFTCGMYDAAGDWVSHVGIPAKSGVAGGIIGALPGQCGLGTFSPRLDSFGNSTRGVQLFERLSEDMGMHLMGTPPNALSVLRDQVELVPGLDGPDARLVVVQGAVNFAGAEQVLRQLVELSPGGQEVILDVSRVASIDNVGRRMVLEGMRRLGLDGHPLTLVDPEQMLPDPDTGGEPVRVVESLPG
ncbi:glutaminase [Enemella evansiae]|uniref:Glutaminase n=1 Tax=Enemella evansiae TaxID=2016499 RepID=A0A255G8T5_9ACTN|nr:glutaminase [Enemella evansiae]OYO10633.1 glutaminase [Enemella evansiae]